MGGLAETEKAVETGGGEQTGVRLFLQGGGTGGPAVWVGVLSAVRRDDVGDGDILRGVLTSYHW